MGEYANYLGQRIKIGTCEDMLYLRWDQRGKVTESETPLFDQRVLGIIRFRFPWPDEDNVEPGGFEDPFRGFALWGFEQPTGPGIDHGMVQFRADNGYLVSLSCPEEVDEDVKRGLKDPPYVIHRNGYGGPASLVGQAWRGGRLVGIARCNGCRHQYRLEEGYEESAAVSIRSQADREIATADRHGTEGNREIGKRLHEIADRLLAGYQSMGS
jgi:hypothetical protein